MLTEQQAAGLRSSNSDRWYTPPDLLMEIADFLGGSYYDPCPPYAPGKPIESGLWERWVSPCFVNPPYGRVIGSWVVKAMTEPIDEVLLLVPARTDAAWFQSCYDHSVCFIRGRLRFSGAAWNAPFPSALVYRGPRHEAFAERFGARGRILRAVS